VGDHHRRHLDVDAVRDAHLPRGPRSIPDYIYEAAEVDRASKWRQFWSITLPMALPFIMLAVLFRGIENFKMFDMVNLLTGGGPGSTTEVASITLKREAFEKWRTGYSSAFAIILFVTVFGLANIYVKALNRVKQTGEPWLAASPRPIRSSNPLCS
jgi:multiple sugar transport system permease protein